MLHAIEMGWYILNKYYTMSDHQPVYAAALLLDPSKRTAYIQQNWPTDWLEGTISAARTIWEREYKDWKPRGQLENPPAMPAPPKRIPNQLSKLLGSMKVKTAISADIDDFNAFIASPALEVDCTPLQWWLRVEQRRQYPRLSRMAIDILSIPPESAEAERTFSGARRTASWDRLRLTCTNIEKIECIGNWLREGHIKPLSEGGMGLICEPTEEDNSIDVDMAVDDTINDIM